MGKRGRPPWTQAERERVFWSRVDKTADCWVWQGPCFKGYGYLGNNSKVFLAHRFAYESMNGPIPQGMFVLHRCDNRPCVNPSHLWLGTAKDNIRDCIAKGRYHHRIIQVPLASVPMWQDFGKLCENRGETMSVAIMRLIKNDLAQPHPIGFP